MCTRLVSAVAAAWLLAGPAAAAQSSPTPPANDDCLACHGDPSLKRDDGRSLAVDVETFDGSAHGPMACVECHADLAKVTEFPHEAKLAKVECATCHDDIAGEYRDSIHWWAADKAGLVVAPSCHDCHGTHNVRSRTDRASRVFPAAVPTTCGSCHAGVLQRYDAGVHGTALKQGSVRAPVCIDCHTAHQIKRADTEAWRLGVAAECGSCHVESERTFLDTFHGQETALGFVRVAKCADCHGAHDIFPRSDARSSVAPARLVTTCGRCHGDANVSFVQYDPHADRHNRARSPGLYFAARFMNVLLLTVFVFFGLHTMLWLFRGLKARGSR